MSEAEKQKDKKLYSYKRALSQPYWIQKFNDNFSLKNPIKLSRVIYFVFLFGLFWFLFEMFFSFLPYGLRGMVAVMLSTWLSAFLSELVIDGKSLIFYIKDYLLFYINHGMNAEKYYINKGQRYRKMKSLTRERKEKNEHISNSRSR